MRYWMAVLMLIPAIGWADLVLDVRGNDPGYMTMVEPEDVTVIKELNFIGLPGGTTERDGFSWQAVLAGMETACLETDRNPCRRGSESGCMDPIGRVFDDPPPTLPFTTVKTQTGGSQLVYGSNNKSLLFDGQKVPISFSRFGCADLGMCDWGDCPWAVVFPEQYTAACIGLRFFDGNLRRQHLNFWSEVDGEAKMVGHFDLVGETGINIGFGQYEAEYCFVSEVAFRAITTWQNGGGTGIPVVKVGEPATTACERAQREADNATDSADQICLVE